MTSQTLVLLRNTYRQHNKHELSPAMSASASPRPVLSSTRQLSRKESLRNAGAGQRAPARLLLSPPRDSLPAATAVPWPSHTLPPRPQHRHVGTQNTRPDPLAASPVKSGPVGHPPAEPASRSEPLPP